jgi:capsid assembly protease
MNNLWLGSQSSYEAVLEAKTNALANYGDKTDDYVPKLLDVQGNVGVITVKGSLVNGNAGYMSYYGVTGYGDLREALLAAIQHPSVSSILMNYDTGGGAVAGVHETAQLIARVDKIKPVFGYNGGTQASAGLWLGSSVRKSYIAETAITGSLGIIMVHAERSKQLEQDGVKVTVIRAGSEKALASQYEPLSAEAKASLEAQAQVMYDIFLGHVATQRGLSNTVADTKFGQGKEFIGAQAVAAGLVDYVGTLEDAYTAASKAGAKIASKAPARTNTISLTGAKADLSTNLKEVLGTEASLSLALADNAAITEGTDMPKPLTQEQLIALAAGVELEAATETTETTAETTTTVVEEVKEVTPAAAASELTMYLQTQVKELQATVATLTLASTSMAEAAAANKANLEALADIGRNSVKTMTIALGGKADAIAAMSASDVVAEHARVSAVFKTKFKVGGVAATDTSEEQKPVKAAVSPLFLYAAKSLK